MLPRPALLTLAVVLALGAAPAHARVRLAPGPRPSATTGWLAFGGDGQLTNASVQPTLTPATVRALHTVWQRTLDGSLIASPLAATSRYRLKTGPP